jgi:GTP pyrophosphokinase
VSCAIDSAIEFAKKAHAGHYRFDGTTPYFAHLDRVAKRLHDFGLHDPAAICIAYLHDTIEDTRTDYDDLSREFGDWVACSVVTLTKDKRLPEPHREREYYGNLEYASDEVLAVKLADTLDNYLDAPRVKNKALVKVRRVLTICAGRDSLDRACCVAADLLAEEGAL